MKTIVDWSIIPPTVKVTTRGALYEGENGELHEGYFGYLYIPHVIFESYDAYLNVRYVKTSITLEASARTKQDVETKLYSTYLNYIDCTHSFALKETLNGAVFTCQLCEASFWDYFVPLLLLENYCVECHIPSRERKVFLKEGVEETFVNLCDIHYREYDACSKLKQRKLIKKYKKLSILAGGK